MNIVICSLYICNYLDKKVSIAVWRDTDKKTLIKRANAIRNELLKITPEVEIRYEEDEDNCFGGRKFYIATIVVGCVKGEKNG